MNEVKKEFDKILDEAKAWHESALKDAKLNGQLTKLEEEISEVKQALNQDEYLKEWADVAIVCGGLRRWDSLVGYILELSCLDVAYEYPEFLAKIREKIEVNKKRTWKETEDGSYHH